MPDVASPYSWARQVAEDIRAHEAGNIEESVERRSINITTLIRKSLNGIPAALKSEYLDELDTHFPAAALGSTPAAPIQQPKTESAADTIRRRLPELTAAERNELLRQLLEGALRGSQSSSRLSRLLQETPRKTDAAVLDPERVLRLLEIFGEALFSLQRLAIELWREVGARKLNGAPLLATDTDFRAVVARCLAGDPESPPTVVEQEIDRQRRAIAAAMAMLGPFAFNYAQAALKLVAPDVITNQASEGSVSMFGNREATYWKHYCRTWESLGPEQFETVFFDSLAKQLRSLNR